MLLFLLPQLSGSAAVDTPTVSAAATTAARVRAATANAAQCTLSIIGYNQSGGDDQGDAAFTFESGTAPLITEASFQCSATQGSAEVHIAVNERLLGRFKQAFKGVKFDARCLTMGVC